MKLFLKMEGIPRSSSCKAVMVTHNMTSSWLVPLAPAQGKTMLQRRTMPHAMLPCHIFPFSISLHAEEEQGKFNMVLLLWVWHMFLGTSRCS